MSYDLEIVWVQENADLVGRFTPGFRRGHGGRSLHRVAPAVSRRGSSGSGRPGRGKWWCRVRRDLLSLGKRGVGCGGERQASNRRRERGRARLGCRRSLAGGGGVGRTGVAAPVTNRGVIVGSQDTSDSDGSKGMPST